MPSSSDPRTVERELLVEWFLWTERADSREDAERAAASLRATFDHSVSPSLLEAARWVVENWDRQATQHASIPALRAALAVDPPEVVEREWADRQQEEQAVAVRVTAEERDAWKLEAEEAREVAQQVRAEVSREEPPTMSRIASMMRRISEPSETPIPDEAAKALYHEALLRQADHPWEALPEDVKAYWRDKARAALDPGRHP